MVETMVVKKRNTYDSRFVLPLVNDDKEKDQMKAVNQTVPQHLDSDEDTSVPFWRKWGSGHQSDAFNSKKHDSQTLPSWGNPQDGYYITTPLHKSQIIVTTKKKKPNAWSFLTFCLVVIAGMTHWHLKSTQRLILIETGSVLAVRNQINIQLRSAEKDVRMLSREVAATTHLFESKRAEVRHDPAYSEALKELQKQQKSLDSMRDQVGEFFDRKAHLRDAVQRHSRNAVESKYGENKKIQVELTLDFVDGEEGPSFIKVEMASLDLMPHAVHTFLEMISNGLWDGCSFVMNAMHVFKAAPLPYDNSERQNPAHMAAAFVKNNLNGPMYKEYSELYKHTPLTLGFSGDNSPSFYINTEDNSDLHAGDSAFAKVVSGFDTLQRVASAPKKNGIWLKDRIGIKSTKIIVD